MFKISSAALAATVASAIGRNDGSNRENSYTILLPWYDWVNITLSTYNVELGDGRFELKGDLKVSGSSWYDVFAFGFCFRKTGAANWDCMKVDASAKIDYLENDWYKSAFLVQDYYSSQDTVKSMADLVKDDSGTTAWTYDAEKSTKACT